MRLLCSIALVAVSLILGHFQEKVKVNVNSNIDMASAIAGYDSYSAEEREEKIEEARQDVAYDYYKSHEKFSYLFQFKISELSKIKWILTLVLVFIHLVIGCLFLTVVGSDVKFLLWGYLVLFTVAGLVYIVGVMINVDLYPFSRRIIGFLQSIIPAGMLYMVFRLNKESK